MNLFTSHWKKPRPVFLFQYPHFFVYFWRGVGFCFVSLFLLLFFVLGGLVCFGRFGFFGFGVWFFLFVWFVFVFVLGWGFCGFVFLWVFLYVCIFVCVFNY